MLDDSTAYVVGIRAVKRLLYRIIGEFEVKSLVFCLTSKQIHEIQVFFDEAQKGADSRMVPLMNNLVTSLPRFSNTGDYGYIGCFRRNHVTPFKFGLPERPRSDARRSGGAEVLPFWPFFYALTAIKDRSGLVALDKALSVIVMFTFRKHKDFTMSHFVKVLQEHEAEIDRMIAQGEKGTPISYSMMRQMGMLKPFAVRLPVPLIAVLDEVMGHGLWHSKQEMVYHMIQSAYLDFFESSSEDIKSKLDAIQKDAWNAWERKHKGKVFNPMTERYEAKQPTTPKRGKVRGKPKLERVK